MPPPLLDGDQTAQRRVSFFESLQVGDHVADLIRLEPEFRHVVVSGPDSFGKCFLQRLDRIPQMQRAEWRSDLQRALADLVYGMAARTIRAHKVEVSLDRRCLRLQLCS